MTNDNTAVEARVKVLEWEIKNLREVVVEVARGFGKPKLIEKIERMLEESK